MEHVLPPLPYPIDSLAPHYSRETLEYHHGKHHNAYVVNLNNLQKGTEFENMPLEDIIKKSSGAIYNNSAQVWNHTFFWNCMKPNGGGEPTGALAQAITAKWGSYQAFKEAFVKSAVGNFGSGWTWLVKKADGSVDIVNTGAAGTPLTTADKALMTVDVWEHAYYIDYRNLRPKFVETYLDKLVNWDFAGKNFGETDENKGPDGPLSLGGAPSRVVLFERRPRELLPGLQALLREPSGVHLQHVAHGPGGAVRIQGLRLHLVDVDDGAVVRHEGHRQRQQGVLHAEALLRRALEDEEHALVLRHLLAVHQARRALVGRGGHLGVDDVHAGGQLHAGQVHLRLLLREGGAGEQGGGEGE
jgi:superoxide dismutase, Fe-Mn family